MPHALPLYRADAVRAIERAAFARGVDALGLMTQAGEAAAALLRERWPQVRRVGVLCGTGNNGGDGYVAALALHRSGLQVDVVASDEPRTPEARSAAARWIAAGQGVRSPASGLPDVDAWIDALFGIGLSRAPEAPMAGLMQAVAAQRRPVLALDVPSGIDADRGSAPGAFLPAAMTLCFVAAKRGLFTALGREAAGEVHVDPLGLDVDALAAEASVGAPSAWAVRASALADALPVRRLDSHKGHHGRVLCLGGDHGTAGALVLCAEAAARGGAGWVEALSRPETVFALNVARPEVMAGVVQTSDALASRLAAADVVAVGPGLGQGEWGRGLFEAALASGRPLVLDADALNLLAEAPRPVPGAVLTPHPGEAARLLGCLTEEVQADRFAALDALVARFGAAVVLKGAGTVVAAPGATPRLIDAGHPGMASAGMGDALTGLVAALRAQGLSPFDAAWVGALGHSAAADTVGRRRGLLASDVIEAFGLVLNP
ncbi:NAD(P)H-hydrate dehydratase [Silanimonas sp.]|jgi:NAD(P)H-hydrate epimerase|uniref:NAD(P)H-hydrate dehydratase n=1 Tax=Silanimonas sp. TaxID=1929290 RepID=UPI0037C687F2